MQKGKYSSKYALSDILFCGECGQPYRRQVWSKYGQKQAVWRCDNRLKHGSRKCKNSPTLKESTLQEAIMTAINNVVEDKGEFVQAFRKNVIQIIGSQNATEGDKLIDKQIENCQENIMKLREISSKEKYLDDNFDKEYQKTVD